MLPLFLVTILFLLAIASKNKTALILFSVPAIKVAYFTISTRIFAFGSILPFDYYQRGKDPYYDVIMYSMIAHFLCIFLAFKLVSFVDPRHKKYRVLNINIRNVKFNRTLGWPFVWVCILPAVMIFFAVEHSSLIHRSSFVVEFSRRSLMRFEELFFLSSVIITPFLRLPVQRFLVLTACLVFYLMIGSRSGPVLLISYILIERFLIGCRNTKSQLLLSFLAIYILALTLSMRSSNIGGLLAAVSHAKDLDLNGLFTSAIYGINYILSFSIVINGEMLTISNSAANDWLYYSIIPLPSFIYDRTLEYDSINRFRVNIPYPGFGYSLAYFGFYGYSFIVFTSATVLCLLRTILSTKRDIVELILFYSVVFLPFLIFLQYNLRTGSRLFYVFVIVYFFVAIGRRCRVNPSS
ncbi:hypothetical protein [Nodosilinea sp. E11]|uniref:hypothetical protein n=1 Tax=Nodosilinea sp. E11 TaxID=3037479 RepID=UPI002934A737|nr:hypothetical protein [Nodosilinea sp. E11]WOD41091.1 hypothetical protein RRF56_09825 [Nodosilinea sp. E11]